MSEQWEPLGDRYVPDSVTTDWGLYTSESFIVIGSQLGGYACKLPDDIRLCRRVPAAPALVLTDIEVVALRTYIDAYPYDSADFGGPRPDVATAYNVLRDALAAAGGDDGK